jgi:PAS domain S-box-containing protein
MRPRVRAQLGKPVKVKPRRDKAEAQNRRKTAEADRDKEIERLTRELNQAQQQQVATSEVLKVISSASFDLQTVLDKLVNSAAHLCDADGVNIWITEGAVLRLAASCGHSGEYIEFAKRNPIAPGRGTLTGRVALLGATVHIADVLDDPEFTAINYQLLGNYRTILGVPLLIEGKTKGVIAFSRTDVRPYADKQIVLAKIFADQAVIAIAKITALESKRELQTTLDFIPALAWRTRADGYTEYLNQRWLDYTGLSFEQALGWEWVAALHPDDVAGLSSKWRQILASQQPGEAEARMRRFDGEYRWFLFRVQPLRDSSGTVVAWYGTDTDIEDRKRAESELARSERRYRHLFNFMPISLWQFDLRDLVKMMKALRADGLSDLSAYIDSHPDVLYQMMDTLVAVDVNEMTLKLFGARDRSELLGPCGFLWRTSPETFRRAMESRFRGDRVFQEETKFVALDGRELHVLFTTARVEPEGELALCGLVDVTEQTHARERLQQVQAEFAHAARISLLGELTASIAHELNQPLAAITTNGETALRWIDRAEPNIAKTRHLIERTVGDARRAAEIIARIRTMAAGRTPQWTELSLHEVITDSLMFLRHELQSKNVSVGLDLAQAVPFVTGDRTQLQQVIVNLAVNAIQAMGQSTKVRKLLIRTEASDGRVLCSFEDSGPGIEPQALSRLFERFFTTKETGMGMGLAVSKSIIDVHGGELFADNNSALGGARFTFALPLNSARR